LEAQRMSFEDNIDVFGKLTIRRDGWFALRSRPLADATMW